VNPPTAEPGPERERVLVNFFYAHPVGHAIEAAHYCLGHHSADPSRSISVALNASTAHELASLCPFIESVHAIDHPFVEPCGDSEARLRTLPRTWDWVLDDVRRRQDIQLQMFPGLRDYYDASDRHLIARLGRSTVSATPPGYVPHCRLRLELPPALRESAARRLRDASGDGEATAWIALMPAGSGERALYPSVASWHLILDALAERIPGARFALIGKLGRDRRTKTSLRTAEVRSLLAHHTSPIDCFDIDLREQLALVEASSLFLSPHTGFGLAALAVGTPWLTISGGRWFEYYFNHVPFRSIIPDAARYAAFTQFDPLLIVEDGEDGPRTPSMTRSRIEDDLGRIVASAVELIDDTVTYEQALADYFADLLAAHDGDAGAIWSIDGIHLRYVSTRA
jgi:hypothetical protein